MDASSVPLDTLGHPLPSPCPSGAVDRSLPSSWRDYWRQSPDGTLVSHPKPPFGPRAEPSDEGRYGYFLVNGALRFKHPNGVTYAATGVDSFPPIE